ncbi:MAG: hypothetical protein FWE37_06230 [Spirochaetaceae bacterium]|nr:hypothetical protein [Spirochaetaceae bacterium]
MIRALIDNDFSFGGGKQNYLTGEAEEQLVLKLILQSFYGELFFAPEEGIDWLYYISHKIAKEELELVIRHNLLKANFIQAINELAITIDSTKRVVNLKVNLLTNTGNIINNEEEINL